MKTFIKFTSNWGYKLNCAAFTTFRIFNPDPNEYVVGHAYDIFLKSKNGPHIFEGDKNKYSFIGKAELVDKQVIKHKQITNGMAVLDVGHKAEYLKGLLKRMYHRIFATQGENTTYVRLCLMYTQVAEINIDEFLVDQSYQLVRPPILKDKAA